MVSLATVKQPIFGFADQVSVFLRSPSRQRWAFVFLAPLLKAIFQYPLVKPQKSRQNPRKPEDLLRSPNLPLNL